VHESPLQHILRSLDEVECPVVLGSDLAPFPCDAVNRLIAEGVLRETSHAEEIPRPARFGPGAGLLVRRADRGVFGVANEEDYCKPVPLNEEDIRQYAISIWGVVEKIRKENEIAGSGSQSDNGIISVGDKVIAGRSLEVWLLVGHLEMDVLLGRLRRLGSSDRERIVLTPLTIPGKTELQGLLRDDRTVLTSLYPLAGDNKMVVDWPEIARCRASGPALLTRKKVTGKRTTGSPEAVAAVEVFMAAKALNRAEFSVQAGMTEPTLRRFLETGELQRSSFKLMAERMGLTPEALLRGELPESIQKPRRVSSFRKVFEKCSGASVV